MVEYIVGNYLVDNGKITGEQLEQVIANLDQVRVKMGLLAVAEGIMTEEQANEVNRLQATMDKRFGDIAVEKGYLTEEQISNLLKKQGNTYLAFAQALENANLLQLKDLEDAMDAYQEANGFTKSAMEDLRSDEPERIVPLFLPNEAMMFKDVIGVLVRTLIRCIDRHVYIGKAELTKEVMMKESAFQKIVGFTAPFAGYSGIETGLSESDGGLEYIATTFCKEDSLDKEDVLDAAGEFLNCVNGLYASALSRSGNNSELIPPIYVEGYASFCAEKVCSVPIYAGGKKAVYVVTGIK